MRRQTLLAALACLLSAAPKSFAASPVGTSGAQFLEIEPGARPAGMGYAFSAIGDDPNAVYYNPAGLASLKRVEATGMEDQYFQGVNYDFATVAVPLARFSKDSDANYGVASASLYNLSVGGLQQRGPVETVSPQGTFSSQDYAYALSYAYDLGKGLSLGATGKIIQSDLDGYNASGEAFDVGALYRKDKLSLATGVRNLGPGYGFAGQADPLPRTWFLGAAYIILPGWTGAFEGDFPRDADPAYSFGTEYAYQFTQKISGALRAGYASQNTDAGGFSGATVGGGLGYGNVRFDFAFVPFGDLGNEYQYSLTVKF
ncbi:MAG: PorV/PorQ family protein [Elusimicrobiota bacterium]